MSKYVEHGWLSDSTPLVCESWGVIKIVIYLHQVWEDKLIFWMMVLVKNP